MKTYNVYIMSSKSGTPYTGMTSDFEKRVYQHKNKLMKGFTKKYDVNRLVYFEETGDVDSAIAKEKQIKSWRRSKKVELIKSMNPTWKDLSENWSEEKR